MTTEAFATKRSSPPLVPTSDTRRFASVLGLLRLPGLLGLTLSNGLSQGLGTRLEVMALAWLVLDLTGSSAWLGLVNGATAVCVVFAALWGGVLADSRDARRLLIATRAILAAVSLALAAALALDIVRSAHVLLVAVLSGALVALDLPIARTLLQRRAGVERLQSATALNMVVLNLVNLVGPIALGVTIAAQGIGAAFVVLALGYLSAAAVLGRSGRGSLSEGTTRAPRLTDIIAGFKYVRATPEVAWLVGLAYLVPIAGVFFAMAPLFARDVYAIGASGYGVLMAVYAAGNLSGSSFMLLRSRTRRRGRLLSLAGVGYGIGMMAFALSPGVVAAAVACFAMGVAAMVWQNALSTLIQSRATPELRGRVMSLFTLGLQLLSLGWLIGGLLGELLDLRSVLLLAGGLFGAASLSAYLFVPQVRKAE